MKRGSTLFLRGAVMAFGLLVLVLCLFAMPAAWVGIGIEYSNNALAINVMRSILFVMYLTAVPFFVALYQTMKLLNYIDTNKAFSGLSVKALQRITYSAVAVSVLYAASLPLFYTWAKGDDAPGVVIIGMVLTLAPLAIGVLAAVLRRLLQEAIAMKSENDLTV